MLRSGQLMQNLFAKIFGNGTFVWDESHQLDTLDESLSSDTMNSSDSPIDLSRLGG